MSTIKANDLTNTTGGIPTVKGQRLIPTAWVNFNGTGTVAIRGSENVASITDNGTGNYNVNLTTAMADTNYACIASSEVSATWTGGLFNEVLISSTTSININHREASALQDCGNVYAIVLGGQA